jgi:hypothetical protein
MKRVDIIPPFDIIHLTTSTLAPLIFRFLSSTSARLASSMANALSFWLLAKAKTRNVEP